MTNLSDNCEYFTDEGLPRIDERFYSCFLEKIAKKDVNGLLTKWVERMRKTKENPCILRNATFLSEQLPEEYRERIVFSLLSQYEMLRQRAIEIVEELGYGK